MGDVTWIKGKVAEKARENGRNIVRSKCGARTTATSQTAKARVEVELLSLAANRTTETDFTDGGQSSSVRSVYR